MTAGRRAAFEFSLSWSSEVATHRDRSYAGKINFWRDIFPPRMEAAIAALAPGEATSAQFAPGELAEGHSSAQVKTIRRAAFEDNARDLVGEARLGRFYPRGLAWQELGCFRGDVRPMRIVAMTADALTCDLNHPLARHALTLEARMVEEYPPAGEVGGACSDVGELATQKGPGLQCPYPGLETDFCAAYPLTRMDVAPDRAFYAAPRMLPHLDAAARAEVAGLYRRLLRPGQRALDLMSSWASHLPGDVHGLEITGLGLNAEELAANPRLSARLVHDLNEEPALPFAAGSFDAVICTSSVEYLTRPLEVFAEIARVTRPGGVVAMTFSDRWFPTKVVDPWSDLHPFERQGFVLEFFRRTGRYADLHTESIRGLPRPADDPHIRETPLSDPVFAVWGSVRG